MLSEITLFLSRVRARACVSNPDLDIFPNSEASGLFVSYKSPLLLTSSIDYFIDSEAKIPTADSRATRLAQGHRRPLYWLRSR